MDIHLGTTGYLSTGVLLRLGGVGSLLSEEVSIEAIL